MEERKITPIANNMEKWDTYRKILARYKLAVNQHFYFEAVMISYAMLEDRLIAFLYHSGAIANRDVKPQVGSGTTKGYIKEMVEAQSCKSKKVSLGITNISGKIKVTKAMLSYAEKGVKANNRYCDTLLSVYSEKINIAEFKEKLSEIIEWCKYRNELVHAMLNKNVLSMDEELSCHAQKGLEYARYIDACVDSIKYGNKIRKAANLQCKK